MLEAQKQAEQDPAEEAEPKAEQAPKGKAPPLAKPKAKPQPQPQAPHPPLPPPPPLVARKSVAAVPAEHPEVEEARGELKGLSASLAASKGAKARAEAKVSQCETKLAAVRAGGDADRIRMAEDTLRQAKGKVAEKEEAIEALDRRVRWMEWELAAVVERVFAPFQGSTVLVSSKQGFFGKPRPVALNKTLFWVICSHAHKDPEARKVLYYLPPSRGPLFQFLANKAFLESPNKQLSPKLYFRSFARTQQRSGGSKSALLSAPYQGPTASASSKQGFFGKPRLVALIKTLF